MPVTVGELLAELGLDTSKFDKALAGAQDKLNDSGRSLEEIGGKLSSLGSKLTLAVTAPILGVGGAAIKAGMDAVESEDLFERAFGGMAGQARKWSEDVSDAVGTNSFTLRENASFLFMMTKNMGVAGDEAFKMSTSLTELAGDMASAFNIQTADAIQKITAGMSGEAEPLKRLGILVSENTIKQVAYAAGIADYGKELTETQKVQARYLAIMQQTATVQGNLAETIESPANQLRVMKEEVAELSTEFGMELLPILRQDIIPIAKEFLGMLRDWLKEFKELTPEQRKFRIEIAAVAAVAGPALFVIGQLVSTFGTIASLSGSVVGATRSIVEGISKIPLSASSAATALKGMGTAAAVAGAAFIGWKIGEWIMSFDVVREKVDALAGSLFGLKEKAAVASGEVLSLQDFQLMTRAEQLGLGSFDRTKEGLAEARAAMNEYIESLRGAGEATKELGGAAGGAGKPTKELSEEVRELVSTITGQAAAKELALVAEAISSIGDLSRMPYQQLVDIESQMSSLAVSAGVETTPALDAVRARLEAIRAPFQEVNSDLMSQIILWSGLQGPLLADERNLRQMDAAMEAAFPPIKFTTEGLVDLDDILKKAPTNIDNFGTALERASHLTQIFGNDVGQVFGGAASAIGGFQALFEKEGGGFSFDKFLGGFTKKGKLSIGSIFSGLTETLPAIGALVGPAIQGVKAIIGVFSKPEYKKVMEDVGRDWGISLSEGLAKQIAEDSKRLGNRYAATLINLGAVIEEAGGVTVENVAEWTARTRDLFVAVGQGTISTAEAAGALNEVFPQLAATIEQTGGIASAEFLELIQLNRQFGTESAEIASFVNEKLGEATAGVQQFLENATIQTAEGAKAMGAVVAAAFAEMRAQGVGVADALEQLQPTIQALREQLNETGFSGGAAFNEIARLSRIASDEITGPTLQAVDGLNQAMLAMQNVGLLDQQMFSGLATEATTAYQSLLDQGVKGKDALLLMQPTLQTIFELQSQFGLKVDESTQKLLDEAQAAGIVGEQHMDASERMAAGMDKVVDRLDALLEGLGIKLPEAVGAAADSVTEDLDRILDTTGSAGIKQILEASQNLSSFWSGEFPESVKKGVDAATDFYSQLEQSVGNLPGVTGQLEPNGARPRGTEAISAQHGFGPAVISRRSLLEVAEAGPEFVSVQPLRGAAPAAARGGAESINISIAPQIVLADPMASADDIQRKVLPPLIDAIQKDVKSIAGVIKRKMERS